MDVIEFWGLVCDDFEGNVGERATEVCKRVELVNHATNLFTKENPNDVDEGQDWKDNINKGSLKLLEDCKAEPSLADAKAGNRFQFERLGYFCVDPDTTDDKLIFNRTVNLRDTWAKIQKSKKK